MTFTPLECLALSREEPHSKCPEWLVSNGLNMGRWTRLFGVNCLADSMDCKGFVRNIHAAYPGSEIHTFIVAKKHEEDTAPH